MKYDFYVVEIEDYQFDYNVRIFKTESKAIKYADKFDMLESLIGVPRPSIKINGRNYGDNIFDY